MTKRKLILWVVTICLLAVMIPVTALAATNGWVENADGTWSYYEYGELLRDGIYELYHEDSGWRLYGFDESYDLRQRYCHWRKGIL